MKNGKLYSVLAGICLYGTVSTSSAVDVFLKANGIDGGSLDADHRTWSDAKSFSGNVSLEDCGSLVVEKPLDKASVKYVEKAFSGEIIPKIEIEYVESIGGPRVPVVKIEIKDGYIAEVAVSNSDGPASELLTIAAEAIRIIFTEYDSNGQRTGNVVTELTCPRKLKKS